MTIIPAQTIRGHDTDDCIFLANRFYGAVKLTAGYFNCHLIPLVQLTGTVQADKQGTAFRHAACTLLFAVSAGSASGYLNKHTAA
jgi:hypothetical protein